jgi:hypothetical protein
MIHLVIFSMIPSVQKFQEVFMFGKALKIKGLRKVKFRVSLSTFESATRQRDRSILPRGGGHPRPIAGRL